MHHHFEQYNRKLIERARRLRRASTWAEHLLWQQLRNNQLGVKFRRQVPIHRFILDFYCHEARLCIELDGSQHHTDVGLQEAKTRDNILKDIGIAVIRVKNEEIFSDLEGVLRLIQKRIEQNLTL